MIKTLTSIILACFIASIFIGCTDTPEPQKEFDNLCKQENILAPQWTCISIVKGSYAGVGISSPESATDINHMRRVALANGRSNLAQHIKLQVKDRVKTFTRKTGLVNKEVIDNINIIVSKQVALIDLQDSKIVDSWTAPSGAIYLLVTLPEDTINKKVKEILKSSYKNNKALWQQFKSQDALETLDKEFPSN